MKKWRSVVVVAVVALAVTSLASEAGFAQAPPDNFVATLRGGAEVPPVVTDTRGRAAIDFEFNFTRGQFELFVNRGERITQAHFHCAPAGVNGPIVIFLAGFHEQGWDTDGEWVEAVITNDNIIEPSCGTSLRQIARSMADGRVYVNVHSVANPGGEVRGQVRPAPSP